MHVNTLAAEILIIHSLYYFELIVGEFVLAFFIFLFFYWFDFKFKLFRHIRINIDKICIFILVKLL